MHAGSRQATQRPQVERELLEVQRKLDRLVDALAEGFSLPADEIKARLGAAKARKTALQAELEKLDAVARVASVDTRSSSAGSRRASAT